MVLYEPRFRAVVPSTPTLLEALCSDCSYLDRYIRTNPSYYVALLPTHRAIVVQRGCFVILTMSRPKHNDRNVTKSRRRITYVRSSMSMPFFRREF
jgi:hypothetical protein